MRPIAYAFYALAFVCFLSISILNPQTATPTAPNSDPTYQQLRNIGLSPEAVTVNNLELKKDAATFHLHSGTVCFVAPVQGKVTGAVFVGDGSMVLDPPIPIEHSSLRLLTKSDEFVERFDHVVFRFTDSTYEEIKKAGSSASGTCDPGLLRDTQHVMRHNQELKYNLKPPPLLSRWQTACVWFLSICFLPCGYEA